MEPEKEILRQDVIVFEDDTPNPLQQEARKIVSVDASDLQPRGDERTIKRDDDVAFVEIEANELLRDVGHNVSRVIPAKFVVSNIHVAN